MFRDIGILLISIKKRTGYGFHAFLTCMLLLLLLIQRKISLYLGPVRTVRLVRCFVTPVLRSLDRPVPYVYSLQFLFNSTHHSWRYERKCEWVFFSEHSVYLRASAVFCDTGRHFGNAILPIIVSPYYYRRRHAMRLVFIASLDIPVVVSKKNTIHTVNNYQLAI